MAIVIVGADLPGVVAARTVSDPLGLWACPPDVKTVAVIGAGLDGVTSAALLARAGKAVTLIEAGPRLAATALSPPVSRFIAKTLARQSVTVMTDATVARISGPQGRLRMVTLDDGRRVAVDLVVSATGFVAADRPASGAGARADNAVSVDQKQGASDGEMPPDRAPSWCCFEQTPFPVQGLGRPMRCDTHLAHGDERGASLIVYGFRNGQLAALETIARPADHLAACALLKRVVIGFDEACAPGFNLVARLQRLN